MTLATDSLPNDLQSLEALVSAQRAEIERLKMMIAKLGVLQGSWRVSCVFKLLFSVSVAPALG